MKRLIQNIQGNQKLSKKANNPIKKWAKRAKQTLPKKIQMPEKHGKRCSTSYVFREIKTMRWHRTPIRMVKTKNIDNIKSW